MFPAKGRKEEGAEGKEEARALGLVIRVGVAIMRTGIAGNANTRIVEVVGQVVGEAVDGVVGKAAVLLVQVTVVFRSSYLLWLLKCYF